MSADTTVQQHLHEAIEGALETLDPESEEMLTGWIVLYETVRADGSLPCAGHMYGPREMTTWRALGLVEWVRRFGLRPDEE